MNVILSKIFGVFIFFGEGGGDLGGNSNHENLIKVVSNNQGDETHNRDINISQ